MFAMLNDTPDSARLVSFRFVSLRVTSKQGIQKCKLERHAERGRIQTNRNENSFFTFETVVIRRRLKGGVTRLAMEEEALVLRNDYCPDVLARHSKQYRLTLWAVLACLLVGMVAYVALSSAKKFIASPPSFHCSGFLNRGKVSMLNPAYLQPGDLVLLKTPITRPFGEVYQTACMVLGGGRLLAVRGFRAAILPLETKLRKGKHCAVRRLQFSRCAASRLQDLDLVVDLDDHDHPRVLSNRVHQHQKQEQKQTWVERLQHAAQRYEGQPIGFARFSLAIARRTIRDWHGSTASAPPEMSPDHNLMCSELLLRVLFDAGLLHAQPPLRTADELLFEGSQEGVPTELQWTLPWNTTLGAFWSRPERVLLR